MSPVPTIDPAVSLEYVRRRTLERFDARWAEVQRRLHREGRADRAVLGIPEPDPWAPVKRAIQAMNDFTVSLQPKPNPRQVMLQLEQRREALLERRRQILAQRREDAVSAVIAAWGTPGPHPLFHDRWLRKVRREWPALGDALDALAAADTADPAARPHRSIH